MYFNHFPSHQGVLVTCMGDQKFGLYLGRVLDNLGELA